MKIEQCIPIPACNSLRARNQTVVGQMGKGDSILLDSPDALSNLRRAAKRLGKKVTTRKVIGGWRMWVI